MTNDPECWHHIPDNPYNPHAWILGDPVIGDGCWIGAFTVLDGSGGLAVGKGCDIASGAQIYSHSTVRRVISEGVADIERAATSIGDFVHVGAGAVILMGATIGDHVVIGAGAIVGQFATIPPFSLVVGIPGRTILDGARQFSD